MQLRTLMMLALGSSLFAGCVADGDDDVVDPPPGDPPPRCVPADQRATKTVEVRGTVVDFATGEPVPGASVDITTGWDVGGAFPGGTCPLLASVTTGADGKFGPITVQAGSPQDPPIMMFLVHGAGRVQTADDNRAACQGSRCVLDHRLPVPSIDTARAWRKELAAGGMSNALTRGLVLFKFKEGDGSGAAGVGPRILTPDGGEPLLRSLVPGQQVRFLEEDRATLAPAELATTTASGVAVIGLDTPDGVVNVAGERGAQGWAMTSCLLPDHWFFFEDRTGTP
ncbi:MAG: hypothetical protein KF773_30380 [Deltaproteobacteria bacterium]|nr:hypothetical protein [Deltaproteobacteria bacterium]